MSQTIVITGATAGFGEACARKFADAGWKLVIAGRRAEKLNALAEELGARVSVCPLVLDVRDREAVSKQLGSLDAEFAEVDVLLNNAGLALGLEPAWAVDLDDWDTMIDTNNKGLVYCTRALLPGMVERNRGQVINIGSVAGNWPYPGGNVYGATKAFVQQFSRNLRADLIGRNVRVTNIEPGMAESEFSMVRFKGDNERADQVYKNTEPLTPGDIADIVFWLTTMPERVNVNTIEVMSINQTWAPLAVHRSE